MDNSYEKPSPDEKVLFRSQFEAEELLIANSTLTRTKKRTPHGTHVTKSFEMIFVTTFRFLSPLMLVSLFIKFYL